jgi:CelD/BcsL family acetyltransferase involved in cellulose biosynthesis
MPLPLAPRAPARAPGDDAKAGPVLGPALASAIVTAANDTIFLTPEWQDAWWRHFGRGRALAPVRVPGAPPSGALLAFAPFFDDGGTLRLVGAPEGPVDVADYLDVLVAAGHEGEAWDRLARSLADRPGWRTVVLDNVPDGSPTLTHGPRALGAAGLRVSVEPQARCPVIALPGDFDAYVASLDRDARHELRRKVRRFEREAPGARVRLLRGADSMAALPDFVRLHRLSGADKARFMTPAMERFFGDMAAGLASRDRFVLAFLDLPGAPPAAAMCLFDHEGGWYLYNSGYDPAHARLAPGFVLLVRCIEAACRAGVRVFDFLRGTERYKYDLGGRDRVVHRVRIERGER